MIITQTMIIIMHMTTPNRAFPNIDTASQEQTLFLLQLANSSFPTGAFNHSFGFETWFSDATITDGKTFKQSCRDWLVYCVARSETIAVARACEMARLGDNKGLLDLDDRVGALKLSRESREASLMTGQALLNAYSDVFGATGLEEYAGSVHDGTIEGHHSVVFGAICGSREITGSDAVLTFLHAAITGLAGVASRLIPLGQVETQRIIASFWPLIKEVSQVAVDAEVDDMNAATVSLEVASMQHECLRTRLCIS